MKANRHSAVDRWAKVKQDTRQESKLAVAPAFPNQATMPADQVAAI